MRDFAQSPSGTLRRIWTSYIWKPIQRSLTSEFFDRMMQIPEIKRLGTYLIDAGLVTPAQIDVALNDQEFMDDMRIGDILVTRGWIKQQTLDFVIDKVVDPEQAIARQVGLAESMVKRHQPLPATATVAQPMVSDRRSVIAASTRIPEPSPNTIAHARSLDGSRVLEILKPQKTYTVVGNPVTDPGQINERKPLSSVPADGDEMNWVG
jgi:hypothetical protein